MWTIAFGTLRLLDANLYYITPLPAILTLRNPQIHVGSSNYSNNAFNVEASVDDLLGVWAILGIPNINPNDYHIRLGKHFDNAQFRHENNVIKDMVVSENTLNIVRG